MAGKKMGEKAKGKDTNEADRPDELGMRGGL